MKKIIAALSLSLSLSACYPLIQDHSEDNQCASEADCNFRRAALLSIIAGGGLSQPNIQPYHLPPPPPMIGGPLQVQIVP